MLAKYCKMLQTQNQDKRRPTGVHIYFWLFVLWGRGGWFSDCILWNIPNFPSKLEVMHQVLEVMGQVPFENMCDLLVRRESHIFSCADRLTQ